MNELHRVWKTLVAYLKHPELYPELGRKLVKNTFYRKKAFKGKEEAEKWLSERAMNNETFFKKHGLDGSVSQLESDFAEEYEYAKVQEVNCPIQMGGAGNLNLLYNLCEKSQAKTALETGVAYGWSSLAILASIHQRDGVLYSSDMPYLAQDGDRFVGCVVPEKWKTNWRLFRFADRESLPKIFKENNQFDFVHYDSDKSYDGMMWAYEQLFPKVNKGGYFVSDDVNDNAAFMDFCVNHNLDPDIIFYEDKYIGVLKK